MKTTTILLLLLCSISAFTQDTTHTFHFKEVGWTVTIPAEFKIEDSAAVYARMKRGMQKIEDATDIKADISATVTLLGAIKDRFNYINATITPHNESTDGNHAELTKQVNEVLYSTMAQKIENGKIDTLSTTATIDGLTFDKFVVDITLPNLSFQMVVFSKLYKGYSFGITYVSVDPKTKEQIETILKESRFTK